ncbi:MAG TPA: SPASM domain-containing protein [Polyangiaceae bacterium]|nr:SPASM domain-containing protein [Polyangiaceae bacterium]
MSDPKPARDLERKFCSHPFRKFETLVDGNVAPCCSLWVEERLGNIDQQSFEEIWNSDAAQRIRRSIHDGSFAYCRKDRCKYIIHGTLPDRDAVTDPYLRQVIDEQQTVLTRAPDWLFLAHDVTCNLSCPSCRSEIIAADEKQEARLDVIERTVIKPILNAGSRVELSVSGQGDPWSSKHYRSILRYVADNHFELSLTIHTNGLLMTRDRWASYVGLEKYKPVVDISIDACRPWTYSVVRRNGDFRRLEENLTFIAEKRKAGAFSELYLNATIQLDNFHELPALALFAKRFGCDGMRYYMIQKTGDHLDAETYAKKNVASPDHPLHLAFLETLRADIFDDPTCFLYDMEILRQTSRATRLPSDENPVENEEHCVALVQAALEQGEPVVAAALAAHGRVRFPESAAVCLAEGSALEALGFAEQARYRYREALSLRPSEVDAHVCLGTNLVEAGEVGPGLRELFGAASLNPEGALLDELAGYVTRLVELAQKRAEPNRMHLPVWYDAR